MVERFVRSSRPRNRKSGSTGCWRKWKRSATP